jgi:hypothetical protein
MNGGSGDGTTEWTLVDPVGGEPEEAGDDTVAQPAEPLR